ncbi:MAG TPA: hypothetical protein PKB15_03520 [Acidimicrobiia bacterium]|nr:hypothetical protein [Acidimicrobiia bacterium]
MDLTFEVQARYESAIPLLRQIEDELSMGHPLDRETIRAIFPRWASLTLPHMAGGLHDRDLSAIVELISHRLQRKAALIERLNSAEEPLSGEPERVVEHFPELVRGWVGIVATLCPRTQEVMDNTDLVSRVDAFFTTNKDSVNLAFPGLRDSVDSIHLFARATQGSLLAEYTGALFARALAVEVNAWGKNLSTPSKPGVVARDFPGLSFDHVDASIFVIPGMWENFARETDKLATAPVGLFRGFKELAAGIAECGLSERICILAQRYPDLDAMLQSRIHTLNDAISILSPKSACQEFEHNVEKVFTSDLSVKRLAFRVLLERIEELIPSEKKVAFAGFLLTHGVPSRGAAPLVQIAGPIRLKRLVNGPLMHALRDVCKDDQGVKEFLQALADGFPNEQDRSRAVSLLKSIYRPLRGDMSLDRHQAFIEAAIGSLGRTVSNASRPSGPNALQVTL